MRNACHLPPAPCPRLFRAAEVLYICSTPLPVPPSPGATGVAGATAVPAMAYTERSGEVATGASAGDVSVTRQGAEEVCGQEYFTKVCLGGGMQQRGQGRLLQGRMSTREPTISTPTSHCSAATSCSEPLLLFPAIVTQYASPTAKPDHPAPPTPQPQPPRHRWRTAR